ncbi:MAG: bifunctional prephenate dehydrogenase/3-phosphoshikimate 1-carboxyvinyltransferase [Pseudomonadales bacterium]|nr:bifunctional prephenate dehydrogenase/3-phosphoshikimate 1-carboxyvinyltransferase [Pseudomonadales bacterium]
MRARTLKDSKVVILGLGLIGGSIARGLSREKLCAGVWAVGRNETVLGEARNLGVLDGYSLDLRTVCSDADLIVLAVPGLSIAPLLLELAAFIGSRTIMTDVASVKSSTVDAARMAFGEVPANLVPGHPIAGSEKSGFAAANADLFRNKRVILTPLEQTAPEAVNLVTELWQSLGAEVLSMSVPHHDEVLAATSHLPHLLAYVLVDTLSRQGESEEIFRYAAGGFRDFTRIASSDPVMWRDIFLTNADATLSILDTFTEGLERMRQALVQGDGDYFLKTFTRAKSSRDKFMSLSASHVPTAPRTPGLEFLAEPGGRLSGAFRVPGDKSISHRAIMLGSIADGTTTVNGFLEGEDSLATLAAFRSMGVAIDGPEQGRVVIRGVGLRGLKAAAGPLYLGNSGTSMRLLCGLLAAQHFASTLTGDESLSRRPMQRVARPLADMGARIHLQEGGLAPVVIEPATLRPIHYAMPVASAQVKSCLLLASLYTEGRSVITEPAPCRDHTERMLEAFSYPISRHENRIEIEGGGILKAVPIDVPADISSAAFFMVGASISPDSDILLRHVGINPTRIGVINILNLMGADISYERESVAGAEPVADIRVRYAPLHGIDIPLDQVALAIDEFPAIFIAAACASGTTVLRGAEELRVKESDRIQAMADGLMALGIQVQVHADGLSVEGGQLRGGTIDSKGDHRIAMAFVMAALRASAPIRILDCHNVATSFPGFVELAAAAGVRLGQHEH